jgi:Esterase/lipase
VNPEHKELIELLAPVWLVTSHNDYLSKYTVNFGNALSKAGKACELIDLPKDRRRTHAFRVFEPFLPESIETIDMRVKYPYKS